MNDTLSDQPLDGVRVLDFSTLLPGPMAGLILAEAGAEVIKIERPGTGEDMRHYTPKWGSDSAYFCMLNRGKKSLAIDLKDPQTRERLDPLIASADVVLEQFRPGVMDRLGLGYEHMRRIRDDIIYCSITGYGATGPKAQVAGHDLNYIGDTGLLSLSMGPKDAPVVPPALIADLAGGTYPAVVNILLALLRRDRTGKGAHLDIAMTDNMFMLSYWAIALGRTTGVWPENGRELLTGGSPRYHLYATRDGGHVAVAALEQKFWETFCDIIGLDDELRDDARDRDATIAGVAAAIASGDAAGWASAFEGRDCCCSIVRSMEEALGDEHFRARGLFNHVIDDGEGGTLPATTVPVAPAFRRSSDVKTSSPRLGEHNSELLK